MKFKPFSYGIQMTAVLFTFFLFAGSALAGPPLLCHTFDIGNAKSLPWIGHNWNLSGNETYDVKNLAADAIVILDGDSTVLVHMETLRRAAVYGQKDPVTLKQLLVKLVARSDVANKDSRSAALATFDVGYFAATLGQAHWVFKNVANPAQGLDGYALVKKAIQSRGDDPQMAFAAALITLDGPSADHQEYAQKAFAGAKSDPLLAHTLASHFMSPQSETMAAMISRNSNVKVAQQ
jgi:hypothetical protein